MTREKQTKDTHHIVSLIFGFLWSEITNGEVWFTVFRLLFQPVVVWILNLEVVPIRFHILPLLCTQLILMAVVSTLVFAIELLGRR